MNNRFYYSLLLYFFIAASLFAWGRKEEGAFVQISGKVRLVGSSAFSELVITGSEIEWYVAREESHKLHDLQHRTVTVEGFETVTEMQFANGLSAGTRRELKKIKIISIN